MSSGSDTKEVVQKEEHSTTYEHDDEKHVPRRGSVDPSRAQILANLERMNDAIDGENSEHAEGMWAGFKKHPWACLWAFILCFTIVSFDLPTPSSWSHQIPKLEEDTQQNNH